jgi:bifunctional DNA-binding transcriptional regulator/antitoxin component of YhaV-PrlF toxin-antitoxin module
MTTLKIRANGTITIPASLRKKYSLDDGKFLTAIDLGEGTILLKPGISKIDQLSKRIEKAFKDNNVTLDDMLETLEEERKKYFKEKYGKMNRGDES